jgi:hypothetical protein
VTDQRTAEEKRVHAQRTGDEPPVQQFGGPVKPTDQTKVIGAVKLRSDRGQEAQQDDQRVAS